LIQYRSVTDTQPPSQPPSHVAVAITLNALAKASSLKIIENFVDNFSNYHAYRQTHKGKNITSYWRMQWEVRWLIEWPSALWGRNVTRICPDVHLICTNDLSSLTVCLNLLICELFYLCIRIASCNLSAYRLLCAK